MTGPDGRDFPWGEIVKTHEIGEYQIVEYIGGEAWRSTAGKTMFDPYVNGEPVRVAHFSLDDALIGAIAHKRGETRGTAAYVFDMLTLGKLPDGES